MTQRPAPALGLDAAFVQRVVALALAEDVGPGDVTTLAIIPVSARCTAVLNSRVEGVVDGLPIAIEAFRQLDAHAHVEEHVRDGDSVRAGDTLLPIHAGARADLTAERVALNFVQRMSDTATAHARYVEAVAGTKATIIDTRKTTPELRQLEKYAVRA